MKNETRGAIHFAIKDMLKARERYPDMYTDDRIMVMAISAAAAEEPDAGVRDVYQAVGAELVRCLAEEGDRR